MKESVLADLTPTCNSCFPEFMVLEYILTFTFLVYNSDLLFSIFNFSVIQDPHQASQFSYYQFFSHP